MFSLHNFNAGFYGKGNYGALGCCAGDPRCHFEDVLAATLPLPIDVVCQHRAKTGNYHHKHAIRAGCGVPHAGEQEHREESDDCFEEITVFSDFGI